MEWNEGQREALAKIRDWLDRPRGRPYFYLAGYAGTGKTTIARHAAEHLGDVRYAAPTGKAAEVMRSKGCDDATTVHRTIYRVKGRSQDRVAELEGRLAAVVRAVGENHPDARALSIELDDERERAAAPSFDRRDDGPLAGAHLLVVDEGSMLDERVAEDLLSYRVPVLVLGDPGQLPPVKGRGYFTAREPDHVLEEVHRQEAGSPVLELATRARLGEGLPLGRYGESRVIPFGDMVAADARDADVILTGTNATRRALNKRVRRLFGREGVYPVRGDRLIALRNRHELGVYNGTLLTARNDARVRPGETPGAGNVDVLVAGEDAGRLVVSSSTVEFLRYDDPKVRDPRSFWDKDGMIDLDYAYALTVHKAQGSQWDHVLIVDDGFAKNRPTERRRWLYTAITRAARSVTIALR